MGEKRYMISDASKQVHVEAHVLRYWEDELELDIPRNEMGHRYYTEEHIHTFKQVKELKENGYQLKAIKMILPKLANVDDEEFHLLTILSEEMNKRACSEEEQETDEMPFKEEASRLSEVPPDHSPEEKPGNVIPLSRSAPPAAEPDERFEQFQQIMNDVVSRALLSNSKLLGEYLNAYIGGPVTERLIQELGWQFQNNEEQQEARFKQLDERIRMQQQKNIEAAAAKAPKERKKRRLFAKDSDEI